MRAFFLVALCVGAVARSQMRDENATAVNTYLSFREQRLERRLNRSRTVLANLEARYQYVMNALTFQNYKAAEMVQRAVNDSTELNNTDAVLAAMVQRVPVLQLMVNSTLRGEIRRFGKFMATIRANVSELLENPVSLELDNINASLHNRSTEFEELERAISTVEDEVGPWQRNFTREARRLSTDYVDGLLLRMANRFAEQVKAGAEKIEAFGAENLTNSTA